MVQNVVLDVSSNNHPTGKPITWAAVAAAPVRVIGVAIKATQGTNYTNPYFAADLAGCVAHGLPVVAYHYADFGTAAAEAAYFKQVAGKCARVLDVETSTNTAWIDAFWAAVGGASATTDMTYGSASTLPRTVKSELWPADYSTNPGFGAQWQAGDNLAVPGIPVPTDYSVVLTQTAFHRVFGTATVAPQPPADPQPITSAVVLRQVTVGPTGRGWATVPTATRVASAVAVVPDPAAQGHYSTPPLWDGLTTDDKLTFRDGAASSVFTFFVRYV